MMRSKAPRAIQSRVIAAFIAVTTLTGVAILGALPASASETPDTATVAVADSSAPVTEEAAVEETPADTEVVTDDVVTDEVPADTEVTEATDSSVESDASTATEEASTSEAEEVQAPVAMTMAQPAYQLALWIVIDSDASGDIWEQRLVASVATDSLDLNQLDYAATACGTYQVDLYYNSATTASLLAGGVLWGSNNPPEDMVRGVDNYKMITVTNCTITPPGDVPTFNDVCGVANDSYSVPPNGAHYNFTVNDQRVNGVGVVGVDLNVDKNYNLPVGTVVHWEHNFTNEDCPLTPPADVPTFNDVCGVANDSYTVPISGDHYYFDYEDLRVDGVGLVGVNLYDELGYAFPEGTVIHWEHNFTNEACPVTPPADVPTFNDVCGVDNDGYVVPANGEHYNFTVNDQRVNGVGVVGVDLNSDKGYAFPEGTVIHWEHNFTNEACATTTVTTSTPPQLAVTGGNVPTGLMFGAGSVITIGFALILASVLYRRRQLEAPAQV